MSPISECQNKVIKSGCLSLNPANPASIHQGGVHVALIWYLLNKLKNTHGHDVVGLCCSLVLALSIQAIEYELDFNLFSGVAVNQVISPSGDNIGVSSLKFFTSKAKSVVLMPIVFVDKGQTPIRTIPFSLILCLKNC